MTGLSKFEVGVASDRAPVVRAASELDCATSAALRQELVEALGTGTKGVCS